ncbi:Acyltransferase family [Seminavis robusta]|uniref:Acyltransferase family n=1 Tax=Seminavis robusta TaxID=568900 RepID=A0A9N8E0S7_9STRA|nr:Acyltransferase family [Seminavis robusta]|eukprot:Sro510_g157170.1 Acyltransferase family (498) ;mRNA; f:6263-7877
MQRLISLTSLVTIVFLIVLSSASANAFTPHTTKSLTSTRPSTRTDSVFPATHPIVSKNSQQQQQQTFSAMPSSTALKTTGGDAAAPPAPAKRIRISAFDSMRFFLIVFICIGHFIRFVDPSKFVMNFFAQVNVVVGAFFVLSGYVTAYTATTNGAYEASPKLKPSAVWTLSKVFGYWPLHMIVLAIFAPVFLYADVTYNGWFQSAIHGLMSATMTQAWFPMHAEVWNAPSWFLSALAFATATLPFALPHMAKMKKSELKRTMLYLVAAGLIPKLGYSYDHNVWGVMEGVTSPKAFPNMAIFNNQRFNPFFNTVEVLLGAAACRVVMLDGVDEDKDKVPQTNTMSSLLPLVGMIAILALRATEVLQLNDMLTRCLLFLPLFVRFMMSCHRAAVAEATGTSKSKDLIVSFLSSGALTNLGSLAFPMFLVHGPIGQICYKKIIATKLFGGTLNKLYGANFFYAYLGIVVGTAFLLKKLVLESKAIGTWSKNTAAKWSKGM